jgi:hypothetical protein
MFSIYLHGIILDALVLLYAVFSSDERIKKYTRFLLLANGTAIALLATSNHFNISMGYGYLGTALILLAYYFLCPFDLFLIANCTLMFGVVFYRILGGQSMIVKILGGSIVVVTVRFTILGVYRFDMLEKIHTIFVIHIWSTYLDDRTTQYVTTI